MLSLPVASEQLTGGLSAPLAFHRTDTFAELCNSFCDRTLSKYLPGALYLKKHLVDLFIV